MTRDVEAGTELTIPYGSWAVHESALAILDAAGGGGESGWSNVGGLLVGHVGGWGWASKPFSSNRSNFKPKDKSQSWNRRTCATSMSSRECRPTFKPVVM